MLKVAAAISDEVEHEFDFALPDWLEDRIALAERILPPVSTAQHEGAKKRILANLDRDSGKGHSTLTVPFRMLNLRRFTPVGHYPTRSSVCSLFNSGTLIKSPSLRMGRFSFL